MSPPAVPRRSGNGSGVEVIQHQTSWPTSASATEIDQHGGDGDGDENDDDGKYMTIREETVLSDTYIFARIEKLYTQICTFYTFQTKN